MSLRIEVDHESIAAFCARKGIRRLSFFGSVLRDDFGPESDVDVLVQFEPGSTPSLFGLARMQRELSEIVGRCAYGGDRFVVKRHGKPLAAIVPIEDMYVAQYVEDQLDSAEYERALAAGELEKTRPWSEIKAQLGL